METATFVGRGQLSRSRFLLSGRDGDGDGDVVSFGFSGSERSLGTWGSSLSESHADAGEVAAKLWQPEHAAQNCNKTISKSCEDTFLLHFAC
ncbi:hypothetical protein CJJ07_003130 [Candidozyma auris]|nr:hypothetical protein CJJ07_003130 [[Candida] auris]